MAACHVSENALYLQNALLSLVALFGRTFNEATESYTYLLPTKIKKSAALAFPIRYVCGVATRVFEEV